MKIKSYGGLDFQLLGIGRTGHIGFNRQVLILILAQEVLL
jgi:hypothetical protein